MFGNIPNNNNGKQSVNTRSIMLFGEISCLTVTWWDDKMSLKINPLKSVDDDGKRTYDTDKRVTTALTQEKAAGLHSVIKTDIMPVICEHLDKKKKLEKQKSIMIPVNKADAVGIEVRTSDKQLLETYLVLYKNIKSDNTCDEKYEYKFNQLVAVKDYDAEKGTGEQVIYEAEFLVFKKLLDSVIESIAPIAHNNKVNNANKGNNGYQNGYNNNGYNNQSNGGYGYGGNNQQQSAPVSNMNDNDDLPF